MIVIATNIYIIYEYLRIKHLHLTLLFEACLRIPESSRYQKTFNVSGHISITNSRSLRIMARGSPPKKRRGSGVQGRHPLYSAAYQTRA